MLFQQLNHAVYVKTLKRRAWYPLITICFLFVYSDACDLYTWGDGTTGMLGHGENGEENVPRVLEALLSKDIWKVACGVTHTIAVTSKFSLSHLFHES